jgi:hypothetical protein
MSFKNPLKTKPIEIPPRKGIHPRTVNKQAGRAGEAPAGAGARTQQPGARKLVRVAEGGKLHRRGGKTHFPCKL